MVPLALALALITTQPTYILVESFPTNSQAIIGSPKADFFYIENRKHFYTPAKDKTQGGVQIFEKPPGKAPKLIKSFTDSPALLGTDNEGRAVYQTSFVKTTTIGREPEPYDEYDYPAYKLDSGMQLEYRNDLTLLLSGPPRRSPVDHIPLGYVDQTSTAILTSRPWEISSDGLDHFITLEIDTNEKPQNLILSLYRWGDKINTLETKTTYKIPCTDGKSEFHITGLAAVKEGLCYIVLETWTRTDSGYADIAKREILAINITKHTQSVVDTKTIDGPKESGPHGGSRTSWIDLKTIQSGKFLAVVTTEITEIYQRP